MVGNGDAAKLGNFSPRLTLRCTPNTAPAVFLTLELVFLVNGSLHYMSNTRKKLCLAEMQMGAHTQPYSVTNCVAPTRQQLAQNVHHNMQVQ